ncbi:aspartate/tyrosine/aromatic aminotransferase [SAR116 cluster alpha proteobacterium HIMB100]|nr:aspartate/tyrosine/aromatic aminotransferase [SAR116 cluster alpha proteobacterium HIMB100]
MLNPDFSIFNDNMFLQVREILNDVPVQSHDELLDVTVGEPRMPPPDWLAETLAAESNNWQAYPKAFADQAFLDDLAVYISTRFPGLAGRFDLADHIVPVPGTREPLHLLGWCVRGAKQKACALVSNPFYHAWRAGALASGGQIVYINASADTGFLPSLDSLDEATLSRCTILYLCSPTNPHGVIASPEYIAKALQLARQFNFLLVVDECYIDIWRKTCPTSALEVAYQMPAAGDDRFANLVVLNSLSKRSNAAGLRAGFLCGDKSLISAYKLVVANGGALVPTPLLRVAGALYRDDQHNQIIRQHYSTSFDILSGHVPVTIPGGGFFLWYPVPDAFDGDDAACAQHLFRHWAVKVVPGSVMAKQTEQGNPAAGYLRLAIVHDHDKIDELGQRLARFESSL